MEGTGLESEAGGDVDLALVQPDIFTVVETHGGEQDAQD